MTLTVAGVAVTVLGCGDEQTGPTCMPTDANPAHPGGAPPEDVEEIAAWILSVAEADLVPELETRLAGQWSLDSVFAALLLAGARNISSEYGGGGFHAVLQVAALRLFVERAPEAERLLPLVSGILITRSSMMGGQAWVLPPIDESSVPGAGGADARFLAAVEAGALGDALAEVTALARSGDIPRLHGLLLEVGCRRAHHLGHEAICAAKVTRVLADLPGPWAEDVYRAMVHAMVGPTLPPGPDHSDVWAANRAKTMDVPCTWMVGEDDPSVAREIAVAMRSITDPLEDVAIVEAHLNAGVSARTIWDGLALAACESAFGGANYHAITSVEALHDAYLTASSERVRLMLLLQGAAYVALVTHPSSLPGVPMSDLAAKPATLDEVFATFGVGSVERALGYLENGGDAGAYIERVMATMRTRANEEHHYKIPHAALLEAERIAPQWRNHVLAQARLWAPSTPAAPNRAWELTMAAR